MDANNSTQYSDPNNSNALADSGTAEPVADMERLGGTMDEILEWLRQAGERLGHQESIAEGDVDRMKEQFQQHEGFMLQLTERQNSIGAVLQEGNQLLSSVNSSRSCVGIQERTEQLNNDWEQLRLKAMERQAQLQQALMGQQQLQLDELSSWLTASEAYMNGCLGLPSSLQELRAEILKHEEKQRDIELHQDSVNALQSMVVVVDETSNTDNEYAAVEQQLESLGSRWALLCGWSEERGELLQSLLTRWEGFEERRERFLKWLRETEDLLKSLQSIGMSEIRHIAEHVQCIKAIENDMDEMMKRFEELNDFGFEVSQRTREAGVVEEINSRLQDCQERWDHLVQLMERNTKMIKDSGVELFVMKSPGGSQTITISRKNPEESITCTLPPGRIPPVSSGGESNRSPKYSRQGVGPQRKEFDHQVAAFYEWLDQSEISIGLVASDSSDPVQGLSVDEQLVLVEDAEKDVEGHASQLLSLKNSAASLKEAYRAAKESSDTVDDVMMEVDTRWNKVQGLVKVARSKVSSQAQLNKFNSELSALSDLVKAYEAWAGPAEHLQTSSGDYLEISRQLEQCRVKHKSLMSRESDLIKLNSLGRDLMTSNPRIESELSELNDIWRITIKRLNDKRKTLSSQLNRIPSKTYTESLNTLARWLDDFSSHVESKEFDFRVGEVSAMKSRVAELEDLQQEMLERSSNYDYVRTAGDGLLSKSPGGAGDENAVRLKRDLDRLVENWNKVESLISERVGKYVEAIDKLLKFQTQLRGVLEWVDEMELFVISENPSVGDIETLQAQLLESEGVQEDVRTMNISVDSMNSVVDDLLISAEPGFKSKLSQDMDQLLDKWKRVVKLCREHMEGLKESIERTERLLEEISEYDSWIEEMRCRHLANNSELRAENIQELDSMIEQYKSVLQEIDAKSSEISSTLSVKLSDLLNSAEVNQGRSDLGEGEVKHDVMICDVMNRVEKRQMALREEVEDRYRTLLAARDSFRTFTDLLQEEERWMQKVEDKTNKSIHTPDAEELSELLDALEYAVTLQKHQNRTHLYGIRDQLINDNLLVTTVTQHIDTYNRQRELVLEKAGDKVREIEMEILKAQQRETQIIGLTQWITDTTDLLQARLDADILAADTPREFQSIKEEVDSHGEALKKLEQDFECYRERVNTEPARRLQQQLATLRRSFEDLEGLFVRFQRPSDFEPKLELVKQELDDVREQMSGVEGARIEGASDIHRLLSQCLKCYKKMSELKTEVEYVLKLGRSVVDKRQVDAPEILASELDTTKKLYNDIGTQIANAKTKLDQALQCLKSYQKELTTVEQLLNEAETSGAQSESLNLNCTEELDQIKNQLETVEKIEEMLRHLVNESKSELKSHLAAEAWVALQTRELELETRLHELNEKLLQHQQNIQEERDRMEGMYRDFEGKLREVSSWIESTNDLLKMQPAGQSFIEISARNLKIQKLINEEQKEMNVLLEQIEVIRSTMLSSSRGAATYKQTMEPRVEELQQRWNDACEKLQDYWTTLQMSPPTPLSSLSAVDPSHTVSGSETDSKTASPSSVASQATVLAATEYSQLGSAPTSTTGTMPNEDGKTPSDAGNMPDEVGTVTGDDLEFSQNPVGFISDCRQLSAMLYEQEKLWSSCRVEHGCSDIADDLRNRLQVSLDAVSVIQSCVELAEARKDLVLNSPHIDIHQGALVVEMLNDLNTRTVALFNRINLQLRSLDVIIQTKSDYVDSLDGVTCWLNHTENVINDQVHVADRHQMEELLNSVKTKEKEVTERKIELEILVRSSPLISSDFSTEDKQISINHECGAAVDRWNQVVPMLPAKRHLLNEKLSRLERLEKELHKLSQLIPVVKHQMERLQPHLPTSDQGLIQDVQVIYNVLESGETDMRTLKKLYSSIESESSNDGTTIPEDIVNNMSDVRAEWTIIHSLALVLKASISPPLSTSRTSSVDNTATNLVSTANPETMETELQKVSVQSTQSCVPVLPLPGTKWPELTAKLAAVDNAEHISLLDTTSRQVLVGDIADIEKAVSRGRALVDDLERAISTADSLCQSLLSKSKSDREKTFLKDTLEELEGRRDGVRLKQTRRCLELEDMLLESRQLDQMSSEFSRWVESVDEDFSKQQQQSAGAVTTVAHHIAAVEELLQTCKNLELESRPWQSKVDAVRSVAESMKGRYSNDDVTQLNNVIAQTEKRWSELHTRLSAQSRLLQNRLNTLKKFDSEAKDLKMWLTRIEIELGQPPNLDKLDQARIEEIREEVELERRKLAVVNAAGEQLIRESTSTSTSSTGQLQMAVKLELEAVNRAWNKLTDSVPQLLRMTRKSPNADGKAPSAAAARTDKTSATAAVSSTQLLKNLLELNDWLMGISSELNSRHSPGGSTYSLQYQLETNTSIRRRLDQKQAELDEAVRVGRDFLHEAELKSVNQTPEILDENKEPVLSVDNVLAEERERVRKIESSVDRLELNWADVNNKCEEWKSQIRETMELVKSFENVIEETSHNLEPLERTVPGWADLESLPAERLQKEYNQAKTFHGEVISMKTEVDRCRIATAGFCVRDESFALPEACIKKLDDINSRWLALESAVEARLDKLVKTLKEVGPASQYQLSMTVFPPWERALADANKVPYFINHSTETTQWDHPDMTRIQQALAELNTVKFSAYRTSMKLRILQKRLSLDQVSVEKFRSLLESYNLTTYSERMLTVTDLISILTSLFEEAYERNDKINIPLSVDLTLNWLLNLYDSSRTGQIQSLAFKVAIIVMCRINLEEKYKSLYHTVSNASGRVDEHRLGLLLYDCIQIVRQLGEIAAFGGSNIDSSVRSCFNSINAPPTTAEAPTDAPATTTTTVTPSNSSSSVDLEESMFLEWMKLEPQSLVWLPVLHRLSAAEGARHQARCNVCRECPIVGFRYRCLKCFNFDLCQSCFFSGRKSKNHKLTHPMQEYCNTTTSGENVRDFTQTFKNKFRSKRYFQKHPRLGYLPVETVLDGTSVKMDLPPLDLSGSDETPPIQNGSSEGPTNGVTPNKNGTTNGNAANGRVSPSLSFMTKPKCQSTSDMHNRLGVYANRLSEVERKRREGTPDWEDEHNLIAQYCNSLNGTNSMYSLQSPMQILMAVDAEQKAELETLIKDLEEENRVLQAEYDNLRLAQQQQHQQFSSSAAVVQHGGGNKEAEMIAEAKLLRQHKGKLEARMQILEDHNRQLDSQLHRLKQLLASDQLDSETRIVTYPFSQQHTTTADRGNTNSLSLPRRVPPSFRPAAGSASASSPTAGSATPSRATAASAGMSDAQISVTVAQGSSSKEAMSERGQQPIASDSKKSSNFEDLIQTAGDVNKAMKSLVSVTVESDDFNGTDVKST